MTASFLKNINNSDVRNKLKSLTAYSKEAYSYKIRMVFAAFLHLTRHSILQNMKGSILVNGHKVNSLSRYRNITGFVPQEDVMHRKLTAREVLTFQGRLRLPATIPANMIKHRVEEIMKLLEIAHVANTQIGDEVNCTYQYVELLLAQSVHQCNRP